MKLAIILSLLLYGTSSLATTAVNYICGEECKGNCPSAYIKIYDPSSAEGWRCTPNRKLKCSDGRLVAFEEECKDKCPDGYRKVQDAGSINGWRCEIHSSVKKHLIRKMIYKEAQIKRFRDAGEDYKESQRRYKDENLAGCVGGSMSLDGLSIICPDGRVYKLDASTNQLLRHLNSKEGLTNELKVPVGDNDGANTKDQ